MRDISIKVPNPLTVKLLLTLVLLEIFLGGGGRLIDIGALSPRMYLFTLTLFFSFVFIVKGFTIKKNFFYILLLFTGLLVFSFFIGVINQAPLNFLLNDVKPLLSIYSLLFFYFTIRTEGDVKLVVQLIKTSAIILSLLYVASLILINTQAIQFLTFYNAVVNTEEFFFRGTFAFFYKGFIYICVGLLFLTFEKKVNISLVAILLVSIVLTFTRGFIISVILTYLFYLAMLKKDAIKLIFLSGILIVGFIFFWDMVYTKKLDRSVSDSARIIQIQEVVQQVTPLTMIIGHGFGHGVKSRPEKMEIAFLEIFHKQGLIGLAFWTLVMVIVWSLYKRAQYVKHGDNRALPFLLSVVLIYIQSFTNPYINNPIGLTMILLSLVCLNVLGSEKKVK